MILFLCLARAHTHAHTHTLSLAFIQSAASLISYYSSLKRRETVKFRTKGNVRARAVVCGRWRWEEGKVGRHDLHFPFDPVFFFYRFPQDFKVILQRQRNCTTSLLQSGFRSLSLTRLLTLLETFFLSLSLSRSSTTNGNLRLSSRRHGERSMMRLIDRSPSKPSY